MNRIDRRETLNGRLAIPSYVVAVLLFQFDTSSAAQQFFVGDKNAVGRHSIDSINHERFDALLKKHVDKDGLVDYRGWKRSATDMRQLDLYLAELSTANPKAKSSKASRLAFWINAYNAVTLRGVLKEYPTASIRDHTSAFFGYNIWHDFLLYVNGELYSLHQIEHDILRKMNEPRIHFAVVCASKGCPKLINEAFVAERLEAQLENNAIDFFSRPRHFQHDKGKMKISELFKWYGEDFGTNRRERLKQYAKWMPTMSARKAATAEKVRLTYLNYDWSLNEQPLPRGNLNNRE